MNRKSFLYINLLLVLFFSLPRLQAGEETFAVVIDAGYGERDPGARGANIDEKEINLVVALESGRLIENNAESVRVTYTRRTDRSIELDRHANIVSRNKADLLVLIHTNAAKRGSTVQDTETYMLDLARSEENLKVAMSENSVTLLKDNHQRRCEGFGPNSSESYIIFELTQSKHAEQSISPASEIQKSFGACKRVDRDIRQTGFLVLRKASTPSVLVGLGYISNRQEEQFMRTIAGQDKPAEVLYDAFCKYRENYDCRKGSISGAVVASVASEKTPPPGSEADILNKKQQATRQKTSVSSATSVNRNTKGEVIYKIQFLISNRKLPASSRLFRGYKNVDFYVEEGIYKYTYGETSGFNPIQKMRRMTVEDLKDVFIIVLKGGKKAKY